MLFIILGGSTLWWFWIRVDGILGDLRDSQDRKVVLEAADKVVNLWPARLQHSTQQLAFEKLFQRLVNEDDAEMRTTVEQALERIGPPDDVAVLTTYLRDERSEVRAYCARTLAHDRLKNAPPAVLPAIRDALASDLNNGPANESIRRYLVRSLAKFADQDADLAVTLILKELPKKPLGGAPGHAVDQPPNEVQKEALNGLIRLADRAVHHPDGEVRYQTIVALRDLVTDHRSTRLLAFLAVLDNSDKRVSDAAESALAQLAPPLAPDTDSDVFPTILAHRNPDVRARGLRALGHPVPGARRDFALRSLLQALGDPDQNVQNQASRGLGEMSLDGKADVGVLKEFVVSRKNLEARKAAIEALARVEFTRDDTLIPSLLEGVLKDEPVAAVRLIALNAFCRDRRSKAKQPDLQSTRTQPALELASRDSDPAIRAAAQEALKLGGVISDLEKRLDSPNQEDRSLAAYLIGLQARTIARSTLLAALQHKESAVRTEATKGLRNASLIAEGDLDLLQALAKDREISPEVRLLAVQALIDATLTSAIAEVLGEVLKGDPDLDVRKCALGGFTKLVRPDLVSQVRPLLVAALGDANEAIRQGALQALQPFPPPPREDVPILVAMLKPGAVPERQCYAAQSLGKLAPDANTAVPALTGALASSDAGVKEAVAKALGQMGNAATDSLVALGKIATDGMNSKRLRVVALEAFVTIQSKAGQPAAESTDTVKKVLPEFSAETDLQMLAIPVLAPILAQLALDEELALKALVTLGSGDPVVVPAVKQALREARRNSLRIQAARSLSRVCPPEEVVSELANALEAEKVPDVRREIVSCLRGTGRKEPKQVIAALVKALEQEQAKELKQDQDLCREIVAGLGETGQADSDRSVEALLKSVERTPAVNPKDIETALTLIDQRTFSIPYNNQEAWNRLWDRILLENDAQLQPYVLAISRMGKLAVPRLQVATRKPQEFVRWVAAKALGKIGADAEVSIPDLQKINTARLPITAIQKTSEAAIRDIQSAKNARGGQNR